MRQDVGRELLVESKKHKAWQLLCQIPSIGPIRAAVLGQLQRSKKARIDSRAESKSQSRSEEPVQECGDHRGEQARPVPAVLRGTPGQRDEAGNGPPDPGAQNRRGHLDCLEERSALRRPISETTNSLSVSDRIRSIPGPSLAVAVGFSRHSGSRVSLSRLAKWCMRGSLER